MNIGEFAHEFGRTTPAVVGGKPVRRYVCGEYDAVLSCDNRSIGPINYLYILVVSRVSNSSRPVMFITAERNTLAPMAVSSLPDDLKKELGPDFGASLFLGVFDELGHKNLGIANDCANMDVFASRAISVMKDWLKLDGPVQAFSLTAPEAIGRAATEANNRRPKRRTASLMWALASTVAFIGTLIALSVQYLKVTTLIVDGRQSTLQYLMDSGKLYGRDLDYHVYMASIDGIQVRIRTKQTFGSGSSEDIVYDPEGLATYSLQSGRAFRDYVVGQKNESTWTLFARYFGDELTAALGVGLMMFLSSVVFWRGYLKEQ